MNSPLLALFIRSLREDSRLKFTYFSRAALVLLILLFLVSTRSELGWTNAPGLRFFGTVVHVDLCYIVLAGLSYFSSAISEEKEDVTLGLLRMTDLNPLSILLGKSTSRLCVATLLLAGQYPFTMLAITLGGISLRQIIAVYLAIGAFLFLVSNLALLASVICRRSSGASILTGVTLLALLFLGPVMDWFGQVPVWLGQLPPANRWTQSLSSIAVLVETASPFARTEEVLSNRPLGSIAELQVWTNLALALVFFLLAWLGFERFCGDQKESGLTRAGVARSRGRRRLTSPGRPWRRAIAWKDFYFTTGGKLWLGIKFLIYSIPLVFMLCWPRNLGGALNWEDLGLGMFWIMCVFIGVELAFAAATIFRNEHQEQTLSGLATLPQGLKRVAYEKLLGVLPGLAAAGAYLVMSLPLVARPFLHGMTEHGRVEDWLALSFMISQGMFFLHLVATLSLCIKRGALPLAIGAQIFIFILIGILTPFPIKVDPDGLFLILTLLTVGVTVVLHVGIGSRLEKLSGEG